MGGGRQSGGRSRQAAWAEHAAGEGQVGGQHGGSEEVARRCSRSRAMQKSGLVAVSRYDSRSPKSRGRSLRQDLGTRKWGHRVGNLPAKLV